MENGKMELNVIERLILLNILPKEGNFTTLKIVRKLREGLSFTEEEHRVLNFVSENGNMAWQKAGDTPVSIYIGEIGENIIKDLLLKLDKEEKLTEQHASLYVKFIGE
jgi:hypothetical protein